MLKLIVRSGAQAGMEFPVDRPAIRLGRGSGSDLVLQDSQASRQHAEISQQGDQYYIRDLGSTNGTFVNGQRITGPQLLQPGDQIQIGDTVLAGQMVGMAAAPVGDDWESDLWAGTTAAQPAGGRSKLLIWGLVGLVVILLAAVAVVLALTLGGGKATPTPVAEVATSAETGAVVATSTETGAVVVVPTDTPESGPAGQPMATPLVEVEVPTVEAPTVEAPTVQVQATAPQVQPPPVAPPQEVPSSPDDLEQLPALVQEYLGDVPPDQLPDVIAAQIQSLGPEQVQEMVGALFPGVDPSQLPAVVSASFPGMSEQEIQGLLAMAFPGQTIEIPSDIPVGGRIALGILDKNRNQYDVYLATVPAGNLTLLMENASDPSFSPDGQYIVYRSAAADKGGLRIMKADGSDDKPLTSVTSDRNPRFSPDGQRILYSNVDNNTLHIINRDGSGRRDIGHGKFPDWSPDGTEIVYQGCVTGGRCGLIRANADGSNPRQITTHADDTMPRWKYGNVAFLSNRDGNFEVYVISDNGTWLRRITLVPATDIMPIWNPSGVQLAFRSDRGGDPAVYITSGIGGGDFKQFSAAFGADWMLAGMDWTK